MNNLCLPSSAIPGDESPSDFRAQIENSQEQASSPEQLVLSVIRRLLTQHAAFGIIHWRTTDADGLVPIGDPPPLAADVLAKAKLLAERALSRGQLQLRMLTTDDAPQLLAAPLPGVKGFAISVIFPAGTSGMEKISHVQRCEVELAAAYLAIQRLTAAQTNSTDSAPAVDTQRPLDSHFPNETAVTASDESQAANTALRSWSEIWLAVWERIKGLGVFPRERFKSICLVSGAIVLLGLLPFPHVVSCKVQCEPATRRFVAAPFDARLLSCEVDVGQSVKQGQVLARLDGSDIRSQIAGLQAKLAQSAQRRSAALAQRDASNAEFERLEVQQMQRELEILANRQSSLEIKSPIDGIVVSGDLRRSEGATLAVGEPLFEIAPLDGLIAEIAIPEADITYVDPGMSASIALEATPGEWYAAKVERIHPRNELRENASVFIGEATIENATSQLRPGMSGSARVRVGFRPIGWILFHKPIEALRQLVGW